MAQGRTFSTHTLFLSLILVNGESLTKMRILKELSDEYFHTKQVIFLTEESHFSHLPFIRSMKWLSSAGIASTTLSISSEYNGIINFANEPIPPILVAKEPTVFSRVSLLTATDKYVVFSDEGEDTLLDTLNISYNSKFVLAKRIGTSYSLLEIYKVKDDGPSFRVDLGKWDSIAQEFSISSQSVFQRRSNLQGTEFTYLITNFNFRKRVGHTMGFIELTLSTAPYFLTVGFLGAFTPLGGSEEPETIKTVSKSDMTKLNILFTDPCEALSFESWNVFLCIQFTTWNTIVKKLNATAQPVLSISREPEYLAQKFHACPAHVSVNGWSITPLSTAHVSFLWPTFLSQMDAFSRVEGMKIGWSRYLMPFSGAIWKVVLGWIGICSASIFIYRSVLIYAANTFRHFPRKKINDCRQEQIWTPLFAFFAQGCSEPTTSIRERWLILIAFLVPAVLVPAYSAALTSFLAIQVPDMPLKDMQDFLDHRDYILGSVRTISLRPFFPGNDPLSLHLRNVILEGNLAPENESVAVRRMCSEKFTFISSEPYVVEQNPKCQYYKMRKPFTTFYQSLTVPKNSPYKSAFNTVVRNIAFSGVLETIKRKTFLNGTIALMKSHKEPALQAVTVEEVAVLLVSLAIVTLLSLIILSCEKMFFNRKRSKFREIELGLYPFLP